MGTPSGQVRRRRDGSAQTSAARAAVLPRAPSPAALQRRRWGRIAAGVVMVLLGGLVVSSVLGAAGDRVDVLAVANEVERHEVIEADDLARVRVAVDQDVQTVAAGDLDDVVGSVAATDLVAGSLLSPDQVRASDERVVGSGETIVGLVLSASDAPLGQLSTGADVLVVIRPAGGEVDDVETVQGWLLDVSAPAQQSGDRPVSVVIPAGRVGEVSAAAGEGRVTVSVREQ